MYEALNKIQAYANERHDLYKLAGKQHLSPAQQDRLKFLNDQLPILWDQHRREVAGDWSYKLSSDAQKRGAYRRSDAA